MASRGILTNRLEMFVAMIQRERVTIRGTEQGRLAEVTGLINNIGVEDGSGFNLLIDMVDNVRSYRLFVKVPRC